MSGVTAVLVGSGSSNGGSAVAPGEHVAAVVRIAALPDVRGAAERSGTDLLWLLDAGALPTAQTLPRLVEAGHVPAASLPVDERGEPVEVAVGRFETDAPAPLLEAARERRVPLRHTFVTSLLVERRSVLETAPPDARFGRYAGSEWTGRLFAHHPAVLVPASTIRVGSLGRGAPLDALRAARAGGWGRGETLRELYRSVAG